MDRRTNSAIALYRSAPPAYWLFVAATVLRYVLSRAPSSVHTTYTWWGVLIEAALLVALFRGSTAARRLLILFNLFAAFAGMAIQAAPLDAMATICSALSLAMAALLLTPAMRRHTKSPRRPPAGQTATRAPA
jgi:hypothetical protein